MFENLDITSYLDVYQKVNYTQRFVRIAALKKYISVLEECKETAKGIAGYQWMLGKAKDITMKPLWTWTNKYGTDTDGDY